MRAIACWRKRRAERRDHIVTAHTRDDQAETLLMRLLRGSGIAGLAAMARETRARRRACWCGPLLEMPKAQLIATLAKAKIAFADDPTNRDLAFTRPRLRALMPQLADEGGDARNLARLAPRLARAKAAVEVLADGAERYLAAAGRGAVRNDRLRRRRPLPRCPRKSGCGCSGARSTAAVMRGRPNSARSRPCWRRWTGHCGTAAARRLKQTLAGAAVSLAKGRIHVEPAPPRRRRKALTATLAPDIIAALNVDGLTTPENTGFIAIICSGNRARMR